MLKFLKKNKTLNIILFLTLLSFIGGIFFNALIDTNSKKEIINNVDSLLKNINNYKPNYTLIFKTIFSNLSLIILIWLLGISIIGIPLVLFFYLLKVFMFSFEMISLFSTLKISNFLFIIIYLIPILLNIIITLFLVYYSINYSIALTKMIFFKENYNLKNITKKYIKILFISILFIILISIIESFIAPKILLFLI